MKKDSSAPSESPERTEEVQAIIDRMPTQWARRVCALTVLLIALIATLAFVIRYPDTINGQITMTASVAPIRLVSGANGRLYLKKENKSRLAAGDIIACIESGAEYTHMLQLDSLLQALPAVIDGNTAFPDTFLLGEAGTSYNSFLLAFLQYQRLLTSDIYATMRQNLETQVKAGQLTIRTLDQETELKKQILRTSDEQLHKDSLLLAAKGISEQEYQQRYASHLSLQETYLELQRARLSKQTEIDQNRLEIQRILLEETENKEKALAEFTTRKNELINTINGWKERYVQYAPVSGELEYLGFWKENCFVQAGQELFSVIPDKNDLIGEVMIPSQGAGKVQPGQEANIKLNNYPYDEYGQLKGVVRSVSRTTNKLATQEGTTEVYLVTVGFPEGCVTNFGKELAIDFDTKGTIEIITRRKRLAERLFDNLKSKTEK